MPANTYGRQVVVPLTNKSGGGVIAGDVVVVGTANNDAFTTTTSAAFTGTVGIAQETIADNATGRVLLSGYAALINTTASVTRQDFGTTSTTAKKAVGFGAARGAGTFCQFLTGGTTPDGIVFHPDLGAGSGMIGTRTEALLSGDVTMTTADTFYDGPTLTPAAGVYDVWARVTFGATTAAQVYFEARLIANGGTVIDEAMVQWVGANTSQFPVILDARVTADGTNPILIRGTSSTNAQLMKRDPTVNSSGIHRATLLRLIRVS